MHFVFCLEEKQIPSVSAVVADVYVKLPEKYNELFHHNTEVEHARKNGNVVVGVCLYGLICQV